MAKEGWEEMGKGYVPWSSADNAGWDWPQLLQTGPTVSQHKWHRRVAFVLDEQLCHLSESIDYTVTEWIKYFSKFIKKPENVSQTGTGKTCIHGSDHQSM